MFEEGTLLAIATAKMAEELQDKHPDKKVNATDPTHILEEAIEQMTSYARIIREDDLTLEEGARIFKEMNTLHTSTIDNYLQNMNVYAIKDPEKTNQVLNRFNMVYFEGVHGSLITPFQERNKSEEEPKDFLEAAKQLIQSMAPKLSDSDYVKAIKQFGKRDIAAVIYDTENGSNYGFNTVYIVWKDDRGELKYKELLNSRDTKDYIHLEDIVETNGSFSIKVRSGGSYSGTSWEKDIVVNAKELGLINSAATESLGSQIEKMFPEKNTHALEIIINSLDKPISQFRKETEKTNSGFVTKFVVDDLLVYAKGSDSIGRIKKEAEFYTDAWKHVLMRPIIPKLLGVAIEDGLAVLLTYGTENPGWLIENQFPGYLKAVEIYMQKRSQTLTDFASVNNMDQDQLLLDPFAIDVFNRAIAHTFMKTYMDKEIYASDKSPIVLPFKHLVERAGNTTDKGLLEQLSEQAENYHKAVMDYFEAGKDDASMSLLYFDSRRENLFPDSDGKIIRPVGDFEFARPGPVAFDLSRLESENNSFYVPLYAYACNVLEQEKGNNFELNEKNILVLKNRVNPLSYINLVRTMSSKLSRNCNQEAKKYLNKLRECLH